MTEHQVFIREANTTEYDIIYVTETIKGNDGKERVISIEDLHELIKEGLNKFNNIVKITLDEIQIRNTNGIRFMLKKSDPKLEVTFEGTVPAQTPTVSNGHSFKPPVIPLYVNSGRTLKKEYKYVIPLDPLPSFFGHTGTAVNNHLLIFGGFSNESTVNMTLLLTDINTGKVGKLFVQGEIPPPRETHSSSLIGTTVYIFGGFSRGPELYYNSLFGFFTERLSYEKIEPRGLIPERRCGHSACVLDGKLWIFGGRTKHRVNNSVFSGSRVSDLNDLQCYDPERNEWLRYEHRGTAPSSRSLHTATVVGRKMYVFGGANSSGKHDTSGFCDLYCLDFDTMTWTECETENTPPSPCYGHSATLISENKILFFGGKGFKVHNDIHILDTKKMEWKKYVFAGNTLEPRWGHSATLHHSKVVIFGGKHDGGYYNTYVTIDPATQLLEVEPEETKIKTKGKKEEKNKNGEMINNLQNSVHELQLTITNFGEALFSQKENVDVLVSEVRDIISDNEALRKQLDSLVFEKV